MAKVIWLCLIVLVLVILETGEAKSKKAKTAKAATSSSTASQSSSNKKKAANSERPAYEVIDMSPVDEEPEETKKTAEQQANEAKMKLEKQRDQERRNSVPDEDNCLAKKVMELGETMEEREPKNNGTKSAVEQIMEEFKKNLTLKERIREAEKSGFKGLSGYELMFGIILTWSSTYPNYVTSPRIIESTLDKMNTEMGNVKKYTCYKEVCRCKGQEVLNPTYKSNSWMNALDGSKRLMDMILPGTHNTMALDDGESLGFTQCQSMNLTEQLKTGIRVLDLTARHINNNFEMYNGIVSQDAYFGPDVVKVCLDFLKKHSNETIIINMKVSSGVSPMNNTRGFNDTYEAMVEYYGYHNFLDIAYETKHFITLDDARGKIVVNTQGLQFVQGDVITQNFWNLTYTNKSRAIFDDFLSSVQVPTEGDTLFYHYLSAHSWDLDTTPAQQAVLQNAFAGVMIEDYDGLRMQGIIFMDFPGAKLISAIIQANVEAESDLEFEEATSQNVE